MGSPNQLDWGGLDLIVRSIKTATRPNSTATSTVVDAGSAGDMTIDTGATINLDSTTATGSSHAATVSKFAFVYTTEALTTAAAGSQAEVITLTGVTAGDLVFVTPCGGTNTRVNFNVVAVTTTNTVTLTIYNTEPTNALNGTIKLNVWVVKA